VAKKGRLWSGPFSLISTVKSAACQGVIISARARRRGPAPASVGNPPGDADRAVAQGAVIRASRRRRRDHLPTRMRARRQGIVAKRRDRPYRSALIAILFDRYATHGAALATAYARHVAFPVAAARRFQLILIKLSHYDDDGYSPPSTAPPPMSCW